MSPSSCEPNGSCPHRLKINKEPRPVQKPSSTAASAASSTANHRGHHPVIIYTCSPKVIHTEAHDFMALVQKLTGLSHSKARDDIVPPPSSPYAPPASSDLSFEDNYNAYNANNGDMQLTTSSISSNSLLSPSEAVSTPKTTATAATTMSFEPSLSKMLKADPSDFLCLESPYFLYSDLTEMIHSDGLVHGSFDYGSLDEFL